MNENENKIDLLAEETQDSAPSPKKNKVANFIAKIGCLAIAFFLWYYAASVDTSLAEDVFTSVPVRIVNTGSFSILSGDDVSIDVTVSGKRTHMSRLSADDIVAYVDISDITEAGKHKCSIQYDLPNGINLVKSSTNSISVEVGNTTATSIPVKVNVTNYMLEGGYELGLGGITTDVRSITVTGPENVLNTISHARLTADIGHVTRTVRYSGDLTLIDINGNEVVNHYVKMNITTATATIPVYKYRDVPITVEYQYGYFNHNNCTITVEPSTVRIRGEADVVDSIKLTYTIDEKTISENVSYSFGISLPATVANLDNVQEATVSVELKNMSTRTFTLYNLSVNNPGGLNYEPIVGPIEVTLCGETSVISRINVYNITPVVDLSAQSGGSGTVTAPVLIRIDTSYQGKVYELGSYTIAVKINS